MLTALFFHHVLALGRISPHSVPVRVGNKEGEATLLAPAASSHCGGVARPRFGVTSAALRPRVLLDAAMALDPEVPHCGQVHAVHYPEARDCLCRGPNALGVCRARQLLFCARLPGSGHVGGRAAQRFALRIHLNNFVRTYLGDGSDQLRA